MPPPLVRKIRKAGLAPRVAARRQRDVFLSGEDPSHNVASRCFGDWVATYGARTSSTHSNIMSSENQAFGWTL